MTRPNIEALGVDELEAEIQRHNRLYWDDASPEISDTDYDLLVERLRQLHPDSPVLDALGGDQPASDGVKVRHEQPMLSLEKCYTEEELRKWFGRFEGPAIVSDKIDGVAMSLRYDESGRLWLGATRGNGRIGENITENVKHVRGVPARIDGGPLEVRGEVYLPLSTFHERYANDFANPRNLTAGGLKQKDPAKTGAYGLRFFAYDALGLDLETESEKRARLVELGFTPAPPGEVVDADGGQAIFEALEAKRDRLDYEVDGVVFKVHDVAQHETLGLTSHHPKYAIAYKYQGESGFSVLQDIEWSVSRTGSINPVALIEPVSLSGVTVSRASLHNLGIIERLADAELQIGENPAFGLSAGAKVLVTRRGGVIPHIESLAEAGTAMLHVPEACPSCGGPTERRDDFLHARHAPDCATQVVRRLIHFVSVADIDGFGPKLVEQLFDHGLVSEPADLYTLQKDALIRLERMGEKSAENVLASVEARRTLELPTLLAALGIDDLGPSVARTVAAALGDLSTIREATIEQLVEIDGVGEIVATNIRDGLAGWSDALDRILLHVTLEAMPAPVEPDADAALAGTAFVFTGTLASMGRKDAQAKVRELGAETPSSVTASTTHVVLGDEDYARYEGGWRSSKLKKAEKLQEGGADLRIISETEFLEILGASGE